MASYLVIGACGFIGRHLVAELVKSGAGVIRAVDKKLPVMCNFPPNIEKAFEDAKVQFVQADILKDALLKEAFDRPEGWDYVVNLAAETKPGFSIEVLDEQVGKVAIRAANRSQQMKVKKFVHISDARVYEGTSTSKTESSTLKPWTVLATAHQKAENAIKSIPGLNWVILRPAIVYGPGDVSGIMPRLVIGRVYKESGKKMKMMHNGSINLATVHVDDVCRAIIYACENLPKGAIYNLADQSNTTVQTINDYLERRFKIETGFINKVKNSAAKAAMGAAARTVNEMHMKPWSDLCIKSKIPNTQLTPFIHKELLYDNDLNIDGTAICKTGFNYVHPKITDELLDQEIDEAIEMNQFPK